MTPREQVVVLCCRSPFNPSIQVTGVFNSHNKAMEYVNYLKKTYPETFAETISGYHWFADEVGYYNDDT